MVSRLPFCYGWLIVDIAFVTMAIGVTARTAFSLLRIGRRDRPGRDPGDHAATATGNAWPDERGETAKDAVRRKADHIDKSKAEIAAAEAEDAATEEAWARTKAKEDTDDAEDLS